MTPPGLKLRDEQIQKMAAVSGGQRQILTCADGDDWIEICLLDDDGRPIPGEAYEIQLPDWSIHTGVLDSEGCARYDHIATGTCAITFPKLDGREWRPL